MIDPTKKLSSITISMEELAIEYVMLADDPTNYQFGSPHGEVADRLWMLKEEMYRRCGPEHAKTYIKNARETLKMVGITNDTVVKWNFGMRIRD